MSAPAPESAATRRAVPARRSPRTRGRLAALAGALALGLTATACGGSGSGSPDSLTILAVQDSATLDPFRASYVSLADGPRMSALYDPLVYTPSGGGAVRPHLAESLTTADNGVTWTLKLRQGVQFSDGTPFDAEAVRLTWETHTKPEAVSIHAGYAAGLQMTAADPLTLQVKPPTPNPGFDRVVATHLAFVIAPSALAKGLNAAGGEPVGAGPYKLDSWQRGSTQTYVKNENYWQKDKGLPKIPKITFKNVPDIRQQLDTVRAGGADLMPSSDQATLAEAAKTLAVDENRYIGGQYVQFNLRKAPFDDPRARRAIALALDPADLSKTLDNGYVPAKGFFPQGSPFFDAAASQPSPNKAEAQSLFDQLAAEGKKVDFTYLIPMNPSSAKASEYMQAQLATYKNVSMRIESLEIGAYVVKSTVQRDFQAVLMARQLVDPEPLAYGMFHSQSRTNATGWSNPEADKALEAARGTTDPAARTQGYRDLQRLLAADLPIWVYSEATVGIIHTKNVEGVETFDDGVLLMDRLTKN
ncbi:ABC transporter substrate-binding protein [Streptomycetaceae bacterium NBC_01309]